MKFIISLFIALFLFGAAGASVSAQKKTITVIIFRHADKEPEIEGDDSDPDITVEGQKRAVRLAGILGKYKPARLFSTNYARTIQTVTPFSRINNLPPAFYEPGNLPALVEKILASEDDRNVAVVGHNSTAYQLANLFLKETKYTMPPESDYGMIWILRIKNGKVTDKVISY
jgi:2,3-bisphosphoglycerate-dependent phosphoglycerate mutase